MAASVVRTSKPSDESALVHTIVLAFAADPVARWAWPTAERYLAAMPDFTRAFGGKAFVHDAAHCTEECTGAALWLPPGVHPDHEALGAVLERSVDAALRPQLDAVFDEMSKYHPAGAHWYLPLIGVDPAHQGKGHGGALLTYALQWCDRDGLPAYLESTNPRNVPLYERHGFAALGAIQVGDSPPLVPMLRRAR